MGQWKKAKFEDITPEIRAEICRIVNKNGVCEIKLEKDNIVVVEIKRTATLKTELQ